VGFERSLSDPCFTWLVVYRHISPTYISYGMDDENKLYVLHDCVHATCVWIRLLPSNYITSFFSPLIVGNELLRTSSNTEI